MSGVTRIPVFRPSITDAEVDAVTTTLRSGWLGSGPKVRELEGQFAAFAATRYAVATTNGSAALTAAMAGLGIGAGDEVLIPSFTWPSVFQVIRTLGAVPVFADIEPDYLTLDPRDAARRITPRTRGIVVVHHGGHPAFLPALKALAEDAGVWLIDDAAHACGTIAADGKRIGGHTRATCFSFNAVKNLSAGDGGMLTTDDADLARAARQYVSLGLDRDTFSRYGPGNDKDDRRWFYDPQMVGQRLHMNDIAASLAQVQLARLDGMNARRAALAERYSQAFRESPRFRFVHAQPGTKPSWHMFTLLVPDRDRFIRHMASAGIAVGVHYRPIHEYSLAAPWTVPLPVTEDIARRTTTLPLYPDLSEDDQLRVIDAAVDFHGLVVRSANT
ncbi:MAG: DegT/DnrJ/EryC1/StrS family aminotransferase [Acidobacteria bacterium]|nr:DegT/DnrJ/EryC1/StrS family aminotransferase [Acidobacteriota bacterium]